jgi:hypothetical protein
MPVTILYSAQDTLHAHPCDLLAHLWKDPYRMDRAARTKLTQKPETDCDRDCKLSSSQ